jgi:DNA-binding transcriptional LysR family regulator
MPVSTVSRKIAELEQHLKARLLVRSTRKLALTDAGGAYLEACRRILDDLGEAERRAAGEYRAPRGGLTITAPLVFGRHQVLPVVTEFLREYPEIDVRLMLADRTLDLIDDHLDVAVRIGHLGESALSAQRIGQVRSVVCASPAYLAQAGVPDKPADLAEHTCVSFDVARTDSWNFMVDGKDLPQRVVSRLTVNGAEAAVDAAVAGVGVTRVLSYQAAVPIQAGALRLLLDRYALPPVPVSLLHAGHRLMPSKLRAFIDFAGPRLRTRLAAVRLDP